MAKWANGVDEIPAVAICNREGSNPLSLFKVLKKKEMEQRLDNYARFPSGMQDYLGAYGWHFSKKMCDWAISRMKTKDGQLEPLRKEDLDALMKKYGIKLENDVAFDALYVANMAKADYFGRSISDMAHLALFVKDYLDDPDGYRGLPFTRFYADCIGSGTPVMWEEML